MAAVVAVAAAEPVPAPFKELRPGQTRAHVLKVAGPPRHIARQIFYQRHLEQWFYGQQLVRVRLEFDCPRGREGVLTAVVPLAP